VFQEHLYLCLDLIEVSLRPPLFIDTDR